MAIKSNLLLAVSLVAALSSIATAASATVVYDATGGAENGGDPVAAAGAGPTLADRFLNPTAGTLASVTLNLGSAAPGDTSTFFVELFQDTSAGPGAPTLIATGQDASLSTTFQLLTYAPTSPISLAADTSYYVGIVDGGSSSAVLGNTLDAAVLARPDVVSGASYYNNGGVQANTGGPYEISVDVSAAPEPSTWALMIAGIGVIGTALNFPRRRKPACEASQA